MKFIVEIAAEILGMFVGDIALTAAVLAIIAAAAVFSSAGAGPVIAGLVLCLGCPLLLVDNVRRAAARARSRS